MSGMQHAPLILFFGDKNTAVFKNGPYNLRALTAQLTLEKIVSIHQTHSNIGIIVSSAQQAAEIISQFLEGDFLVTNVPTLGLAILTADCLPVVMVDEKNHAIGIAHAGWRGTQQRIVQKMLACMQKEYGTAANTVRVIFGPAMHVCCYEVTSEFLKNFDMQFFEHRDNKIFFNNSAANTAQLIAAGVVPEHIQSASLCTQCNMQFCSYRREREHALRQITVVAIPNQR